MPEVQTPATELGLLREKRKTLEQNGKNCRGSGAPASWPYCFAIAG